MVVRDLFLPPADVPVVAAVWLCILLLIIEERPVAELVLFLLLVVVPDCCLAELSVGCENDGMGICDSFLSVSAEGIDTADALPTVWNGFGMLLTWFTCEFILC